LMRSTGFRFSTSSQPGSGFGVRATLAVSAIAFPPVGVVGEEAR
jgi:hypothetical protein